MKQKSLYNWLQQYAKSKTLRMHMPGHKGKKGAIKAKLPYNLDITEIDGYDNLYESNGILKQSQTLLQKLFNSKNSYMLVNGSTCGILAGIRAATKQGDKVLVARNCHKAVYNAIELCNLIPVYMLPMQDKETGIMGSIAPLNVKEATAQHGNIKLIVFTSPTYEGVISDIGSIVRIAHANNIPVLVDEAHGAHLFATNSSAVSYGADIVINSTHKTLPALTQTAIAHFNSNIVSQLEFERQLAVFQTTSPSYLLLASIDECVNLLLSNGTQLYAQLYKNLSWFETKVKQLKHLQVLCFNNNSLADHSAFFSFDKTKVVISTLNSSINGMQLSQQLRIKHKTELEMAYLHHAVALISVYDTRKTLKMLANALLSIDKTLQTASKTPTILPLYLPTQKHTASEMRTHQGAMITLDKALNKISGEYVWAYPPGIPLLVPGEEISSEVLMQMQELTQCQTTLHSTYKEMPNSILVSNSSKL